MSKFDFSQPILLEGKEEKTPEDGIPTGTVISSEIREVYGNVRMSSSHNIVAIGYLHVAMESSADEGDRALLREIIHVMSSWKRE